MDRGLMEAKQHQYERLTRTPVVLIDHDDEGEPIFVDDPGGDTEEVFGCVHCGMGLEESRELPDCMGMSLERMMEEEA